MEIKIRKLIPDLAEDYARFFDVTPHDDQTNKDELPCYCVTWRTDDTYACDKNGNWNHWFLTREERRKRAIQFIEAGSLQGYLAYNGDKIVGWCNTNADCGLCVDYLRTIYPIDEYNADIKIKSIFCFVIDPEMRRKGIATLLVERICKDAADDGINFVEAYVDEKSTLAHPIPLGLYVKCGFIKYTERDGKSVVRRALK